jgi:hypothetical protein
MFFDLTPGGIQIIQHQATSIQHRHNKGSYVKMSAMAIKSR